jgi:predicted MFS family arabinose efflux permease
VRRLPIFAAALVLIDSMLFAALTPLLPHLLREFGISKTAAGFLVAAYAGGALAGGILGGFAATHAGPRRAVLFGLALMGFSSLGFAFAHTFATLISARLVQGLASGFIWSGAFAWLLAVAPRERRGEMLGTAMGSAAFGAMCGPAVGAVAAITGRGPVFSIFAGASLVLAGWAFRFDPAPGEQPSNAAISHALRNRTFLLGLALMGLGALLLSVLGLLGPLRLARAGWGAPAIGGIWLGSAALGSVQAPLVGRLSDRRGPLPVTRVALALGAMMAIGLATGARPLAYVPLIVLAARSWAVMLTTGYVVLAEGAEQTGLPQGIAYGLVNAAWALGAVAGPAASGALAASTGDWLLFLIAAGLCSATLLAIRPEWRADDTALQGQSP